MNTPTTLVVGFDDLPPRTAYEVWRLRQAVFVVEQACAYPDLDGRDTEAGTHHVLLVAGEDDPTGADRGGLVGYARVLDDGAQRRIGRVVLDPAARGRGWADLLMSAALDACGEVPVVLDAQSPLAGWYAQFGFSVTGGEFLDDGIPHLPMARPGRAGSDPAP